MAKVPDIKIQVDASAIKEYVEGLASSVLVDREALECIVADAAAIVSGLCVPVSMQMPLGTVVEPWRRLYGRTAGIGYPSAEDVEASLWRLLGVAREDEGEEQ